MNCFSRLLKRSGVDAPATCPGCLGPETVWFSLLFVVSTAVYSCTLKPPDKLMDIADFLEKKDDLDKFINEHFDSVQYEQGHNPLLYERINLINKTDSLKFCTMNVQQCWVKQIDSLYAFFILIKTSPEIEKYISRRYGIWETRAEISIQGDQLGGDLFSWSAGAFEIDVSTYFNVTQVPRYEMCDLVVCRNMTYQQLMEKPHTGKKNNTIYE
jgi:hypothetical protein